MYERKQQPLAPIAVFYQRVLKNLLLAFSVIGVFMLIGVAGFHYLAAAGWLDAAHNSAMLLSGMGPVITITSVGGKIFSAVYALFSGVIFITNIGVILAPVLHRLFHRLHLEE